MKGALGLPETRQLLCGVPSTLWRQGRTPRKWKSGNAPFGLARSTVLLYEYGREDRISGLAGILARRPSSESVGITLRTFWLVFGYGRTYVPGNKPPALTMEMAPGAFSAETVYTTPLSPCSQRSAAAHVPRLPSVSTRGRSKQHIANTPV